MSLHNSTVLEDKALDRCDRERMLLTSTLENVDNIFRSSHKVIVLVPIDVSCDRVIEIS